ncbi:hypothetical protein GYMLUDRAFT_57727 [Collybiopsis luxurians FD-317 M1]|uniref:Uncharacterized protein n=1 Tax=Collybiopsis luxurians FD-317 M1 TaxID=944289 RepID=A0A0D0CJI2_9AGAR|nr:hypothetical protein GYMLUDRAFT_57727 [Collybiopsis luxurians FD-317 M1]
MSSRRQNRVSTLAIVLPHPPLLRRRSSLLSQGSITSPHTPRTSSCNSPTWLFTNNNNRKSTDSWNSSNQDVGEDCDSEWKPDQILLLSRTLDALPSHLVTPFNGPIPPSNLLDKIARGVANAKGHAEWPHSLRATRVKLIEIARQRAREENSRSVTDENDEISCYSADSDVNVNLTRKSSRVIPRRPLYRQSSMDFLNTEDRKNGENITRLSTRLQRTESQFPNPSYHPYTRSRARAQAQSQAQTSQIQMNRRSSSPPRPANVPSLISPSTPSSSTLSSLSTSAARHNLIRRSVSTFSDSSMISGNPSSLGDSELETRLLPSVLPGPVDPRVQRVRRSESFCNPKDGYPFPAVSTSTPSPIRQSFKRAPSYGALAQEAREKEKEKRASGVYSHIYGTKSREEMNVSPCPSSDEEEKQRNKQAKKVKGPGGKAKSSPSATAGESGAKAKKRSKATKDATCTESRTPGSSRGRSSSASGSSATSIPTPVPTQPFQRMNLQRNPSIFGEELPHLHIPAAAPRRVTPSLPSSSSTQVPPAAPALPPRKTLRRVKRLAPSRRISFSSLVPPAGEETDVEGDNEEQRPKLGSAFQLS